MSNKLMLTRQALEAPKSLSEVFELEPFRDAFALNYLKTTGRDNGGMIFEREKILFLKALQDNKKLNDCERFSVYSSFVELAVSGLTLQDGQAFIIPYGKKAQFQVGWKGRLEQIQQIPAVKWVNTPILVWQSEVESDRFDYEYIQGATTVVKHKPILTRPADDVIAFVYCTIETSEGVKTHLMDRESVLSIRDRYSQPYKSYIAACIETNTEIGKPVSKKGQFGPYTIDPPFWVTDEGQAFKKTLVKRMYSELPKTARMKALDAKIAANFDPEDATGGGEQTEEIAYGIVDEGITGPQTGADEQPPANTPAPTKAQPRSTPRATKTKDVAPKTEEPAVTHETPEGDTVDTGSGEVLAEKQPEKNPVDELPDLNNL